MVLKSLGRLMLAALTAGCCSAAALAQDSPTTDIGTLNPEATAKLFKAPGYSPYAGRNYPTQVYWGDTHLHTANSVDAFAFGDRLGPEEAYRFARGEEIVSSTGQPAKLSRPLDFLVVADHAEALASTRELFAGNPVLLADPVARRWHDMMHQGGQTAVQAAIEMITAFGENKVPAEMIDPKSPLIRSVWQSYTALAERYNEPGRFTALIGYEWTSNDKGDNLHRVVIFRDGKDKVDQIGTPFSATDSSDPAKLWQFLAGYEEKTGGEVLAVARPDVCLRGLRG